MWLVFKILKPKSGQGLEDLALGALSYLSVALYQSHFGYMPIYDKYEDAVGYFPNEMILKLPIEETKIEDKDKE